MNSQKKYYFFKTTHVNAALQELLLLGIEEHCIIEDSTSSLSLIGGLLDPNSSFSLLKYSSLHQHEKDIWTQQWEEFAPNFQDGFSRINLKDYGGPDQILLMKPGAGFGDLSHPTTRLCLEALCQMPLKGRLVIDMGCGSGVLSIAAYLLGAKKVLSIDIDDGALIHTQENLSLNQLPSNYVNNILNIPDQKDFLLVMNMISSEQKNVLNAYPDLLITAKSLIISGILEEEIQQYINNFIPDHKSLNIKIKNKWTCIDSK